MSFQETIMSNQKKTPRTKSAELQNTGQRSEQIASSRNRSRAKPDERGDAPPPEVSNHDHPTKIGKRAAVPGAGIVDSGADAYPKETSPDRGKAAPGRAAPGAGPCDAPQAAAHARHAETTMSGAPSEEDRDDA